MDPFPVLVGGGAETLDLPDLGSPRLELIDKGHAPMWEMPPNDGHVVALEVVHLRGERR
jgi:hypothetical protein